MPEQKVEAKLQRSLLVLHIIRKLSGSRGRWVGVAEITKALKNEGYHAEAYNIRRDLEALSALFHQLECNDNSSGRRGPKRGEAYGYRWAGHDGPPEAGLSLAEALSLVMVERYLRDALPVTLTGALKSLFSKARNTLNLHKKSPAVRWPEKVVVIPPTQPLIPPVIDPEIQRSIHEAVLEERALAVSYRYAGRAEPREMVLHPQGLIQRGPATYLAALAWQYDDVRFYAVHRFLRAEKTDEPARPAQDFDLAGFAERHGHFGSGEPIHLVARVSDSLRNILEETRLAEDQCLSGPDPAGMYRLEATVADTWQLRWWVLSQMEDLQVESPPDLRIRVREAALKSCGWTEETLRSDGP